MNEEQQIINLDQRVTRIETALWEELKSIGHQLTEMQVANARTSCPTPGKCRELEPLVAATLVRVTAIELTIVDFDRWRMRMMGAMSLLIIGMTLFAPVIRKAFNLE